MSAKEMLFMFGTEVERRKMSEGRLSYLCTEQEKPETVEKKVLVKNM